MVGGSSPLFSRTPHTTEGSFEQEGLKHCWQVTLYRKTINTLFYWLVRFIDLYDFSAVRLYENSLILFLKIKIKRSTYRLSTSS